MLKVSENTFFCVIVEYFLKSTFYKTLFFSGEVGNSVIACSGKALKGFVAVVLHINLFVDSTETQTASRFEANFHVRGTDLL